jgi:hypothetical protein
LTLHFNNGDKQDFFIRPEELLMTEIAYAIHEPDKKLNPSSIPTKSQTKSVSIPTVVSSLEASGSTGGKIGGPEMHLMGK